MPDVISDIESVESFSYPNRISSKDPGQGALSLGSAVDSHHARELRKIAESVEGLNHTIRDYSSFKRSIDRTNTGKDKTYDISQHFDKLHEKFIDFEEMVKALFTEEELTQLKTEFFGEGAEEIDLKAFFDSEKFHDALKTRSGDQLEKLTKYLEDQVSEMKDKASDASNMIYLKGHLYTLVMNIFQEVIRTDCRAKERLAQARAH